MNDKQQPYNGQIDEALLTAYALDELEGPERALVEAALKTDRKAQEAVEEIREVAGCLRDAASHDEDYAPSATLREMIEQRLEEMAPAVVQDAETEKRQEGDCPNFRLSENGTVPLSQRQRHRRRWATFAMISAAVLLLAVAIPSLPMFQHGTTSDVAMSPPLKSAAPAADTVAPTEMADEEREYAAPEAEDLMMEAKSAAREPREELAEMDRRSLADRDALGESPTPAKPAERPRTYAKGFSAKSVRGAATSEQPSTPSMLKGSAKDDSSVMDRDNVPTGTSSEKRPDASRLAGKSPQKNERAMTRSIAPKTAPTQPWSHNQAVGPVATPVPYPNAAPGANGQIPLAQSQAMPRAKSARPGLVPASEASQPADAYTVPPAGPPMAAQPALQQQIEVQAMPEGVPKSKSGTITDLFKAAPREDKPQMPQPTFSYGGMGGYGGAAGMGASQAASPDPADFRPLPPEGVPKKSSGQASDLYERRSPPRPADLERAYGESGGMVAGQPQNEPRDHGAIPPAAAPAPMQANVPLPSVQSRDGEGRSVNAGLALGGSQTTPSSKKAFFDKSGTLRIVNPANRDEGGAYFADEMGRERGRQAGQSFALGAEQYAPVIENSFKSPVTDPESTVSADVDTASYANVRRLLENNQVPPPGAVRVEEMVNYFDYDYPEPKDDTPFSVDLETASCPWNESNRLVRIGLKAKDIDPAERGPSNLVFLLDVSGSMRDANKLPLVKDAMAMLVDQLTEDDRVSIVTYAGDAGLALPPTEGTKHKEIMERIEALKAGGSTHGSAGIQMAYDQAMANFVTDGNNRVILCTDGDLNVGITNDNELVKLIQQKASSGVFLTVVGFGTGNLKDAKLEQLADKGNGKYAYVDGLSEAKKVFVEQASGSLVTVAKDVKIQIEFNPAKVQSYRLIGYENRLLATQDFNDDMKDAGEIGAGHSVTFLYEVVPTNLPVGEIAALNRAQPNLRYQRIMSNALTEVAESGELLALKLRYKLPDEQQSRLLEFPVMDSGKRFGEASSEFRFAASVAAFGLLLRGSQYNQGLTFSAVEEFAAGAADKDPQGRRGEFVDLVRRARSLYGDTTQVGADARMLPNASRAEPPAEAAAPPE